MAENDFVPAFLLRSALRALVTLNAFKPTRRPVAVFLPSFFTSWIALELPVHLAAFQIVSTAYHTWRGALRSWKGRLAVVLNLASITGLLVLFRRNQTASLTIRDALLDAGVPAGVNVSAIPSGRLALPFSFNRQGVVVTKEVTFRDVEGKPLRLDVFAPAEAAVPGEARPALIQVHGGAWMVGDKREQGLPLLNHMAANGWVGFNVNYRLSPRVKFPEHAIDVKAAVAWVREHAEEYGVDPARIAITGGSAGGHLAALVALTPEKPEFQPGFEEADTSVMAAVPFYAPFDMTDTSGLQGPRFLDMMARYVIGEPIVDARAHYEAYSPLYQVNPAAPPFFVLAAENDTLVPVAEARRFVDALRTVSDELVIYAEIPGAQHAFDIFHSPRANQAVESVRAFLDHVAGRPPVREPAMAAETVHVS